VTSFSGFLNINVITVGKKSREMNYLRTLENLKLQGKNMMKELILWELLFA